MRKLFVCSVISWLWFAMPSMAQLSLSPVKLPNGWSLTPAGKSIPLSSDLPLNMAISPNGDFVAVTNNGNGRQTIDLIDLKQKKGTQEINIGTAFLGLVFDKKRPYLYASGGNKNIIIQYQLKNGRLLSKDTIQLGAAWPKEKISPTGICLDEKNHLLYVSTKEDNSLYVCDLVTMKPIHRIKLSDKAYTCLFNPLNNELYVSIWGGRKIMVYNALKNMIVDSIPTDDHPTDLALTRNGQWLYAANANANSVSVINIMKRKVVETLNAALYPNAPIGSTTNSLALSADDKALYVANADNNCLAVFDVSLPGKSKSKGFIPTGWYPTCVRTLGNQLLVLNGKGLSSMANVDSSQSNKNIQQSDYKKSKATEKYIGSLFHGTLSMIPAPNEAVLKQYSRQVYLNTPYSKQKETLATGETGNPIPMKKGDATGIKYVFYVLKENRTYDQVLGDMTQGNGDTSLCIFGKNVTPNAHSLSEEFVLLDNFYVDAEVSADGHNWSMAGYATDYVEKNWPSNYSGRGGTYDFDGSVPVANPTKGFIWDYCQRAGVPFRNYGEFMDNGYPTLPVLKKTDNYCQKYPGWNLDITDVYRESIFEHDFDSLVHVGAVRNLNTVYLPNDHTYGMARNKPTPTAYVADNDLALGRLVDHISHSSIWKETAIFILEDDAQDGPDHVDAHRSVAYVVSPFIKRNAVNHTLYTTSSMLRTMELILGLPPMSQYDAAATPMFDCFQQQVDLKPYSVKPAIVDVNAKNMAHNESVKQSAKYDFSKADNVPDLQLNEIIWKSIRGENSTMPTPKRSAFVKAVKKKDNDD